MTSGAQPPNSLPGTEQGIDWEQTLTQHSGWLRAVVANRLGARGSQRIDEVEEVMQEVALAAVKSPSGSINPAKVGAWLYQVAVRRTLMHRRSAGRRRKLVDQVGQRVVAESPLDGDSAQPSGDPLVWMLATERAELIRAAIDNLHRRDREMLILKYEHGWSYRRLVDHLGISQSAVEARLHRARKRLRSELVSRQLVDWAER